LKSDRRTLVIFTSDNGPHHEGNHKVEFFDSNGPLRSKNLLQDIHVQVLAEFPADLLEDADRVEPGAPAKPQARLIAGRDARENRVVA